MTRSILARAAAGAVGGVVATITMSAHLLGTESLRAIGEPPPSRLIAHLLPNSTLRERRVDATVAHLAIGAAGGVAYRLLIRRPGVLSSTAFGVGLWAFGYEVFMPALGVLPPARRDDPAWQRALLQAHLVYGVVLGVTS